MCVLASAKKGKRTATENFRSGIGSSRPSSVTLRSKRKFPCRDSCRCANFQCTKWSSGTHSRRPNPLGRRQEEEECEFFLCSMFWYRTASKRTSTQHKNRNGA